MQNLILRRLTWLCVLVLPALFSACRDTPSDPGGPVAEVVMEAVASNVPVGGTLEITAILTDASGRELSGRRVGWSSSDPGVATVSEDGTARGVSPGVTTITAVSEQVTAAAELSVAPAHRGGVTTVESTPGGPVHLFSPSFGGVHMVISTLSTLGDTIPGVPLRYTEADGLAILTVAAHEPEFLPELMWASPHAFGRQSRSPIQGFRRPGGQEPGTGITPLVVRVFPQRVTGDSDYAARGYADLFTFQWQLRGSGGPCLTQTELADSIRDVLAASEAEGRGRRVVLKVGRGLESGRVAGAARLMNPAMAREEHELYLDSARMEVVADVGGGLEDRRRGLIRTEELSGDHTGGEPWTLVALEAGDDHCNGEVPSRLELLREEPLSGPPLARGRLQFRVTNDFGEGVEDVPVGFQVTEGGGSLQFDVWETNDQGQAHNFWTLGPELTRQAMMARVLDGTGDPVPGVEGSPLTLSFVAQEGPAFTDVEAGCGIRAQAELWCWGTGLADVFAREPAFRAVSRSEPYRGCAVATDGGAYCWGPNDYGQLGNGTTTGSEMPTAVAGSLEFLEVERADEHGCGVTVEGRAYCWGRNSVGELGDGTYDRSLVPVPVDGGLTLTSVSVGTYSSCGVTQEGKGYCWGAFDRVGVGADTADYELGPLAVKGGLTLARISVGRYHTCALTVDDEAYCWGWERDGALGNGTASDEDRYEPGPVVGGHRFVQLEVGDLFACGLTESGRALCWGDGEFGQLGNGSTQNRTEPTPVSGDYVFSQIGVGSRGACALDHEDRVWCWGRAGGSDQSEPTRLREVW